MWSDFWNYFLISFLKLVNYCRPEVTTPLQIKPLIKSLFQFPTPRILGVGNSNMI